MLITTTENVKGYKVTEVKGEVFGLVVRSRGFGGNIIANLKGFFIGGEIRQYTSLLETSRQQAMERMVANARKMGANAIIMMRFDSSEISGIMSEIVAYGTAAVIEKEN
ncbi:MAG: heavy metal-binding domain-containing protein [Desulfotomaculaceae bacterium]|nr:heavy metal-binding domain-containing protein [Desulfotomaculaceae bacterium]